MARDPAVFSLPSYVACPRCHGSLVPSEGGVMCAGCLSHYPRHSTVHFAAAADDPEKAHQQAIYDGQAPDTMLELPYRDVDEYRDYCSRITGIVRLLSRMIETSEILTVADLVLRVRIRVFAHASGAYSLTACCSGRQSRVRTNISRPPGRGADNPCTFMQTSQRHYPRFRPLYAGFVSLGVLAARARARASDLSLQPQLICTHPCLTVSPFTVP